MNGLKTLKNYFAGTYQIRLLLGALVSTVVADGVITEFLVKNRFAIEGNPFLRDWVSRDTFLVMKLLCGLLAALILWDVYKRNPKSSVITASFFVVLYTAIIFWNVLILV